MSRNNRFRTRNDALRTRHEIPSARGTGESLLEVLLAISLAAVLSVSSTRLHASQWRLHRESAQQLRASLLLDAWAETHRMVAALPAGSSSDADALLGEAAWREEAAKWLEHGTMDFQRVDDLALRARVRWSKANDPGKPEQPAVFDESCSHSALFTSCLLVSSVFSDMRTSDAP